MRISSLTSKFHAAQRLLLAGIFLNIFLGVLKTLAGWLGYSSVLIADGIHSIIDVVTSMMTWGALKYASQAPDQEHPYGHGKAESLAAFLGSLILLVTGVIIAFWSIRNIMTWREVSLLHPRAKYTLFVLFFSLLLKEGFFQLSKTLSHQLDSTSMIAEAWHHRCDVMISLTAFLGITISSFTGHCYIHADDWAALLVCCIILYNATEILSTSFKEMMDARVSDELEKKIIRLACEVPSVQSAEKCRVRKSGLSLLADLHIRVDGHLSVHQGHSIAHEVKNRLLSANLALEDITLHLEPSEPLL